MSSIPVSPRLLPVQLFRVERSSKDRKQWTVSQSGVVVAQFGDRDSAADAAHALAANGWRLRQTVARVVVMGDDGRPVAFRMYGDSSQKTATGSVGERLAKAS